MDELFSFGIIGCQNFVKISATQDSERICFIIGYSNNFKKERYINMLSGSAKHFYWNLMKKGKKTVISTGIRI